MIVPGYAIEEEMGDGPLLALHRARRRSDGRAVLLKTVWGGVHAGTAVQQLQRELRVSRQLNIDGVTRVLDLVEAGDTTALVLEDFGGRPLDRMLKAGSLELTTVLDISVELAQILSTLHRSGFTHLNIQPRNILINTETGRVQLTGLGLASRAPREMQGDLGPRMLEKAMAYTSPEQTGRTARLVDYRTDFYSLGITLYETLTGRLPFASNDPLELMHAHVAKQPMPPNECHPGIPEMVSNIVLKLMAKPAEERYQGCEGLRGDLTRCLQDLSDTGRIQSFPLGEHDVPERFELPQRLYGRESEVKNLVQALDDVGQGPAQVVLVSGPPGVGKTSLVQRLRRQVLVRAGYFITGKWDELEKSTPYSGVLASFRDLVRQLLSEETSRLAGYRQQVAEALGPNLGALVEVIPEIRAITGEPPPLPVVGPTEARNRLHRCMQQFVRVFSETQPLVVFLDDLQWADPSSLEFIKATIITGKKGRNVLLMGTCRDNAFVPGHPLFEAFDEIRDAGIPVTTLHLGPLTFPKLERFVADALRTGAEDVAPLADLVYRKTAGNPYFTKAFLTSLREEGTLTFEPESGWTWDASRIVGMAATESAVALAALRISHLPQETRRVVSLAAALGHYFEVETLATICGQGAEETEAHLIEACEERVLLKHGEGYRFEHDQVQEATYTLIPDEARPETHFRISRLLRDQAEEGKPAKIFEIVDHLNRAGSILKSLEEREDAARLNLDAGLKAKKTAAFPSAFQYFSIGITLLDPNGWEKTYDLALGLHSEAAEMASLIADFQEADRLLKLVHDHAKTVFDEIPAYETEISIAYARRQEAEAVRIALRVLRLLGVDLPEDPSAEDALAAAREIQRAVKSGRLPAPKDSRPMTDPSKLATMHLLARPLMAAGWTNARLATMLIGKLVDLTVRFGHSPVSPFAYVMVGATLCAVFNDYERGYETGALGLKLCEHPESARWKSICQFMFDVGILFRKEHLDSALAGIHEAYRRGLESGDLVATNIAAFAFCDGGLQTGLELSELERRIRNYYEVIDQSGVERLAGGLLQLHHIVGTLLGRSKESEAWAGGPESIREAYQKWALRADHTVQQITLSHEMMTRLIFRQHEQAFEAAARSQSLPMGTAEVTLAPRDFQICLCLLGRHKEWSEGDRQRTLVIVQTMLETMHLRAHAAPMNYQHKVELVEAERFRVLGEIARAVPLYEKAIEGARRNRYVHEEALANEMAAEFYLDLGSSQTAGMYLKEAASAYRRWGAWAKLEQLHDRYPELLSQAPQPPAPLPGAKTSPDNNREAPSNALDMTSIERAARALGGELDLGKLVHKLLAILLQNAGAQRGALLRDENGKVVIEAIASVDEDEVPFPMDLPLESSEDLCRTVVRYVSRTYETVVLGDATQSDRFTEDPYIEREKPKSILCTPILHQGKPVAILYLENNRIQNAFVEDRLTAVQLISSQAAAALENARLHEDLKQEVGVRRQAEEELRRALSEVAELKDRFQTETVYLREELQSSHDFEEIVGDSPALNSILHKADQVAATDAAVLVLGETGTGKELIVRAIHARSLRKGHPLVKVNCAAIPGTLIESELFGHDKGAFTGALIKKIGRFELADRGTIFLDEIGDLPLELQAKLLRVLQEGEFERLGSVRTRKINVRIIAATNRDLESAIAEGSFRPDLFYRLSVFPILMPSLRERREDVPLLVWYFITKKQGPLGKRIEKVQKETMEALKAYDWPGNVRELENVIERAMILSPGSTLILGESFGAIQPAQPEQPSSQNLEEIERTHILRVIEECGWKIKGKSNAADRLGLHSSTLRTRMKKLGIVRPK